MPLRPPDPVSDHALVLRARTGDRAAWGELYSRYSDRLYDYACRLTGNRTEAGDCVQDAFVLAVERIGQLRDPDRLRPWLYAIVRSTAHRHYRHANRWTMGDVPDVGGGGGVGVGGGGGGGVGGGGGEGGDDVMIERVTDGELAQLFAEAAEGLTDEDRELLDLHLRHDLTPVEVAAALGVSTRHAAVTTERMRERLGRSVAVAVLSRRPECEEFAALRQAEGGLTPLSRKRLSRHVEACSTCSAQRDRQVRPEVLLGVLPLLLMPRKAFADFQPRLDAAIANMHSGGSPSAGGLDWDGHGFPLTSSARRARWLPWACAALAGLVAGGGLVTWIGRDGQREAGSTEVVIGPTVVITAPVLVLPTVGTDVSGSIPSATLPTAIAQAVDATGKLPLGTPTSATVAGDGSATSVVATSGAGIVPSTTLAKALPSARPPTITATTAATTGPGTVTTTDAGVGTATGTTLPTGATTPVVTTPVVTSPPTTSPPTTASTAPTTTATPDATGPSIGTVSASHADIGVSTGGVSKCQAPPTFASFYPISAALSIPISDPSGVASASFTWSTNSTSGGGALANSAGTFSGTVGPISEGAVPLGGSLTEVTVPISVTVTATDAFGNITVAVRPGVLNVHNCVIII